MSPTASGLKLRRLGCVALAFELHAVSSVGECFRNYNAANRAMLTATRPTSSSINIRGSAEADGEVGVCRSTRDRPLDPGCVKTLRRLLFAS
jgi:hypothetical protein